MAEVKLIPVSSRQMDEWMMGAPSLSRFLRQGWDSTTEIPQPPEPKDRLTPVWNVQEQAGCWFLLPSAHRIQALAVEFQQMAGVLLRLGGGAATLKAHAGRSGPAIAGGHRHKFHEVECDVFVAAHAGRGAGRFHGSLR